MEWFKKFGPRANTLTQQFHPQRSAKGAEDDEDVPVMPSPIANKRTIDRTINRDQIGTLTE